MNEAKAAVAQAEANLQSRQPDYNRYQNLFQAGAIARQQLDTARANYQVALAQKNSAQQQVAQAQENVTKPQAQLAASKGGLQQAEASGVQSDVNRSQFEAALSAIASAEAKLKDSKLQLSYTNITAPTPGRVGNKAVKVGQRVQPGTFLMAIVGNNNWVIANFKETHPGKMHPGQPVEIDVDAFPHHYFTGHLESFAPGSGATFALLPPDNDATGNFTKVVQRVPVKVVFEHESIKGYESRITPGISAVVSVDLSNETSADKYDWVSRRETLDFSSL